MLPLGSGEKIRGQRATEIICDEFACLLPSTIIQTDEGLMPIKSYFDSNAYALLNKDRVLEVPERIFKTPLTDVYKVTTQNGFNFSCSNIHQVMTQNGWKIAKDLTVDDNLLLDTNDYFPDRYLTFDGYKLDEKMAFLLGVLISEGNMANRNMFSITNTDRNLIDHIMLEYADLGWKSSHKESYSDARGWNCKECWEIRVADTKLRTAMWKMGCDYVTARDKSIPAGIMMSPRSVVISFLSGLFEGDGSIFGYQDRGKNRIGVAYYSGSEKMIDELQVLSLKFGMTPSKTLRSSDISKDENWMLSYRGENAFKMYDLLKVIKWKDRINEADFRVKKPSIRANGKRFVVSTSEGNKNIHIGTFDTTEECEEAFKSYYNTAPKMMRLKSVELLPEQEHLYDFYMPKTNSFIGNGFIQHNSVPRDIFENVIAGFGVVSSTPTDNVRKLAALKKANELKVDVKASDYELPMENQIILSGTAYYEFNHFAEYWKKWCKIIRSKGDHNRLKEIFNGEVPKNFKASDYSVIRLPYQLLPDGVMDGGQISRSKATIHSGIFDMEFGAKFSKDSNGFFKRSLIEYCVPKFDAPIISKSGEAISFTPLMYGDKNKFYVFGVDPASEVDKFSISVIELNHDHRRIVHQWTTDRKTFLEKRKQGKTSEDDFYWYAARKIRSLMEVFPCKHIAVDSQGGGIPISEALHNSKNLLNGEIPIWPMIDPLKEKPTDGESGLHILELCNFADSKWLSEANHGLRFDFEQRSLIFPTFDPLVIGLAAEQDMATGKENDTLEELIFEIEELKNELSIIEITQTTSGKDRWDTPEIKTGVGRKGRLRKDRYSSLVMANMAGRQIQNKREQDPYESYGGFSNTLASKPDNTGKMFIGPAWFTEKMGDVY
jgi:intein/homing endonuclease